LRARVGLLSLTLRRLRYAKRGCLTRSELVATVSELSDLRIYLTTALDVAHGSAAYLASTAQRLEAIGVRLDQIEELLCIHHRRKLRVGNRSLVE
jgi:hypothetical protein